MLGWKIFAHSVRMVLGNFKQVLQITIGPALIATAIFIALVVVFDVSTDVFDEVSGTVTSEPSPGYIFLSVGIFSAIMLWIAVSWHRFILLEQYPRGALPSFRLDRILAYFGRILLLAGLGIAFFVPVLFVSMALVQSVPFLGVPLLFAMIFFAMVLFYRASIILPAAAIGRPVRLGEAWGATKGESWTFVALLVATVVFQIVVQMAFTLLAFIPVLGALLATFASFLILPMINVSILTTLYGVYIEKRGLV